MMILVPMVEMTGLMTTIMSSDILLIKDTHLQSQGIVHYEVHVPDIKPQRKSTLNEVFKI